MEKFFNNAGPQLVDETYNLDPLRRIKFSEIDDLIAQKRYFILHAPRQTGKTTAMYAMMRHYNAGTQYRALYVNIEAGQAYRGDVDRAMPSICGALVEAAKLHLKDKGIQAAYTEWQKNNTKQGDALQQMIAHLSAHDPQQPSNPRPLVLMIDEIDALIGDTLISVLRQIRAGYPNRPSAFAQTVILCGVRDVRDYRIHSAAGNEVITGGSAFNIKAESLTLANFSLEELNELYDMHTAETGQVFTAEARELAWRYTAGQPWLVNALAYDCTFRMKAMRDRTLLITGETMREAKERMVLSRATHIDQLIDKLREPRVYRIIAPMLRGDDALDDAPVDDVEYCLDLGLIRQGVDATVGAQGVEGEARNRRALVVANEIYREVIPRELTYIAQISFANSSVENHNAPQAWYFTTDAQGRPCIDVPKLLGAFQQFYRANSEHWLRDMSYREAAPQLLLQAYLQRIVNGGGRIEREYGLGRGRTDLYLTWPANANPYQHVVIEIKVKRLKDGLDTVITQGAAQTQDYMQRCGARQGHLIVFNADPAVSWDDKVYARPLVAAQGGDDASVWLWGC